MKFKLFAPPHLNHARTVKAIMREVILALIPATMLHVYFFGPGLIINFVIACACALLCEYLMLKARRQPVALFLTDYSAVVTAALLAFSLPPITPWWVTTCAAAFAIVIAKQLYGGLGFNTFNPAMAGYAVVLVSFPAQLALWSAPAVGDLDVQHLSWVQSLVMTFSGELPAHLSFDQITRATPLDQVQNGLSQGQMLSEIVASSSLSNYGDSNWILINLAVLAGGLWLLYRRIIRWHIPVALLLALFLVAMVFRAYNADAFSSPFFHLLSGSAMLAAFFIATDPVSAATSVRGRILYAASIGVLIYVIRTFGSYPDGVAFAVLLLNMCVPIIDHFSVPRTYGHARQK